RLVPAADGVRVAAGHAAGAVQHHQHVGRHQGGPELGAAAVASHLTLEHGVAHLAVGALPVGRTLALGDTAPHVAAGLARIAVGGAAARRLGLAHGVHAGHAGHAVAVVHALAVVD